MESDSSRDSSTAREKNGTGVGDPDTVRREAFIALIAPIGIDLEAVIVALTQSLKKVNYDTNSIHLTDIFRENPDWYDVTYGSDVEKYEKYIAAGDQLCEESERNDTMALYGIAQLSKYSDRSDDVPANVVHIFRQLKRVEEIEALSQVYGRNIMFISCYAPRKDRVNYLIKKMQRTDRSTIRSKLESKALDIIATDEEERDKPAGQRVSECYPYADFIVDCSSHATLTASADRFVNIFFGAPFISPTTDEYASYIANAASYRSLDLSRQVGAAIFGEHCELISMGCNEVPRAGGGTYWSHDQNDARDFALGYDSNQRVREDLSRDALLRLQREKWLNGDLSRKSPDELVELAFKQEGREIGPWASSMMSDLIEFGRMVHAEMNALADAARFRRSTIGATLYCTTMPCHMCAKLIIAAGIDRVVYLQPYSKSLVGELFDDSVAIDDHPEAKRVTFDSLKGVTPNGFKRGFHKKRKRKTKDGSAIAWDQANAVPTFLSTFPYYTQLETRAVNDLTGALKKIAARHPQQVTMALPAAKPKKAARSAKRKRN